MHPEDLYSLVAQKRPDEAIDLLFQGVDSLCAQGKFVECQSLLRSIDQTKLDSNLVEAVRLAWVWLPSGD